jgi:hypothetical protein
MSRVPRVRRLLPLTLRWLALLLPRTNPFHQRDLLLRQAVQIIHKLIDLPIQDG